MGGQWHKDWADAEDAKEEREERKAGQEGGEGGVVTAISTTSAVRGEHRPVRHTPEPPTPEVLIEAANDLTDLRPGFIEPTDAGDHLRRSSTLQHQQLAVPIRRAWSISNVRSALGGDPLDAVGHWAK
jgi:hypothetical protein